MSSKSDKTSRKPALGKGLDSLLGLGNEKPDLVLSSEDPTKSTVAAVVQLQIAQIDTNPYQPRKVFEDEAIKSLAASIKHDGVLQPIVVARSSKPGRYTLIAGERRWRASQIVGNSVIPAIVKEASPPDLLRLALIENIQRSDLNPIEEAEAYASLIEEFGLSQEQCSAQVGKDRATVSNFLRLLTLPKSLQVDVSERTLSMGHAKALLSVRDRKKMKYARDIVVEKGLSVRQTEQLCKKIKEKIDEKTAQDALQETVDANMAYLAETLRSHLKTKVRLVGSGSRGKIEISYFSPSELERILELVGIAEC